MKLSIGIVGLPNVGKSTLFKLLTLKEINIQNYPFATIEPNIGIVEVPDNRLVQLARISKSKKIIPAIIEFYDIAGLVKGAYKGEGLGNQFLAHIREVNAILHLVRIFKDEKIIHIEKDVNPLRDIEIIETELIFKDLETIDKRLKKVESEAKSGNKKLIELKNKLINLKNILNEGKLIFSQKEIYKDYLDILKELNLLTAKPQLFLFNGKEEDLSLSLKDKIKSLNSEFLVLNLNDNPDLSELIKKAYSILNLISFFTTGEDETKAWTIEKNTNAKKAAGVIHSDFENKFIKAEVINFEDLIKIGNWQEAKKRGLIKFEGKDYIIKDGDVIIFHHN